MIGRSRDRLLKEWSKEVIEEAESMYKADFAEKDFYVHSDPEEQSLYIWRAFHSLKEKAECQRTSP